MFGLFKKVDRVGRLTGPENIEFLGLKKGQKAPTNLVQFHNAGWYNAAGVRLGYGDLTDSDLARIRLNLRKGEIFVILREYSSRWHLPPKLDIGAPGKNYVAEHAAAIVTSKHVYLVVDDMKRVVYGHTGLALMPMNRREAKKLIG